MLDHEWMKVDLNEDQKLNIDKEALVQHVLDGEVVDEDVVTEVSLDFWKECLQSTRG